MKDRYLDEKPRRAIRQSQERDYLFVFIDMLAQQAEVSVGERMFVLSAEDLHYLNAIGMDQLLVHNDPHSLLARQEAERLWMTVKLRLRNDRSPVEADSSIASTLVAMTVRECLRNYDVFRYWDLCDAIAEGALAQDPDGWEVLEPVVAPFFSRPDVEKYLRLWWRQYDENPNWLSDELEEIIAQNARPESEIPHTAEMVEALKPYFWDNPNKAKLFVTEIFRKSDEDVAAVILRWKRNKSIDLDRKAKAFHGVLTDARYQLYRASYDNLMKQLRD